MGKFGGGLMSKHTKGPWEMHENPDGLPVIAKDFNDIAHIRADGPNIEGPEILANAKLIAAAPDMYEALKALFNEPFIKEFYESHKNKDLIFGKEVPSYLTDCDKICEPFDKCLAAIARVEE